MSPTPILDQFTTLLIGFSIFGCILLLLAYAFFLKEMRKSAFAIGACAVLLGGLATLQLAHFHYLATGADLLGTRLYGLQLLVVPAAFYFFSTRVLMPAAPVTPSGLPASSIDCVQIARVSVLSCSSLDCLPFWRH